MNKFYTKKIINQKKKYLDKCYNMMFSQTQHLFLAIDILNTSLLYIHLRKTKLTKHLLSNQFYFKNIYYKGIYIPTIFIKEKNLTKTSIKILLTEQKLILNKIKGILKPFEKVLSISGANCKFELKYINNKQYILIFAGFSNVIHREIPKNITCSVSHKNLTLILHSSQKDALGQFASQIKKIKPERKYTKGIYYGFPKVFKEQIKKITNDNKKK